MKRSKEKKETRSTADHPGTAQESGQYDPYSSYYIEKCRHCDFQAKEHYGNPDRARCQLCDRFFQQKRLFLNNVG